MADVPNTWPLNGYAPGNYWCRCLTCNDDFQGDKRAYQCLECAVSQIRGLLADLLSERERRTAQGVAITRALGSYGSAFDPPGTKRAYTYTHQPGNVPAWRLGEAMRAAVPITGGDHIDSGLGLLKALEEKGFGVFEIDAAPSLSTSAGGGERG
jgi:hypothetical protein